MHLLRARRTVKGEEEKDKEIIYGKCGGDTEAGGGAQRRPGKGEGKATAKDKVVLSQRVNGKRTTRAWNLIWMKTLLPGEEAQEGVDINVARKSCLCLTQ